MSDDAPDDAPKPKVRRIVRRVTTSADASTPETPAAPEASLLAESSPGVPFPPQPDSAAPSDDEPGTRRFVPTDLIGPASMPSMSELVPTVRRPPLLETEGRAESGRRTHDMRAPRRAPEPPPQREQGRGRAPRAANTRNNSGNESPSTLRSVDPTPSQRLRAGEPLDLVLDLAHASTATPEALGAAAQGATAVATDPGAQGEISLDLEPASKAPAPVAKPPAERPVAKTLSSAAEPELGNVVRDAVIAARPELAARLGMPTSTREPQGRVTKTLPSGDHGAPSSTRPTHVPGSLPAPQLAQTKLSPPASTKAQTPPTPQAPPPSAAKTVEAPAWLAPPAPRASGGHHKRKQSMTARESLTARARAAEDRARAAAAARAQAIAAAAARDAADAAEDEDRDDESPAPAPAKPMRKSERAADAKTDAVPVKKKKKSASKRAPAVEDEPLAVDKPKGFLERLRRFFFP